MYQPPGIGLQLEPKCSRRGQGVAWAEAKKRLTTAGYSLDTES